MVKYTPECPFCGSALARPQVTKSEFETILAGKCTCGAVYVCDPTGRSAGEAYMEALALAKGDWDLSTMSEEIDYKTIEIDYDQKIHQRVYSKVQGRVTAKLVFVKLEPLESGHAVVPAPVVVQEDAACGGEPAARGGKAKLKGIVKGLLEEKNFGEITALALRDKSVIRWLISLAFDKEDVICWRAMEALGLLTPELSRNGKDIVRETTRRLLWSMSDESGGIGWSAAEMLGEMIRNAPDVLSDLVPIVWSFQEEEMFRPGAVWAMGRIAGVRPDLVQFVGKDLPSLLEDKNPAVRGYAAWVIGILADEGLREKIKGLLHDGSPIFFYDKGELLWTTVAEVAERALH